jgi:hypothetical protein
MYVARKNSLLISGKPSQSMVPHLTKCSFVAPDIRAHAVEENNSKESRCGPGDPPMLGHLASRIKLYQFDSLSNAIPNPEPTFIAYPFTKYRMTFETL